MPKGSQGRKGTPRAAAERARTRRAVAVMAGTLASMGAAVLAALLAGRRDAADPAHAHRGATHGGILVSAGEGGDHFHVEAVLEPGGRLRLFTLGGDAVRVKEVETQVLPASVRRRDGGAAVPLELLPAPQPGDGDGKTSRFVGRLPRGLRGEELDLTVPAVLVGARRFGVAFALPGVRPSGHDPAAEERGLYRTPGGKYTEADIRANGPETSELKYVGFKADHDLRPQTGERVCPVTRAKADPNCHWTVGGRQYSFCCPPCIGDFLAAAKERPEEVSGPEAYVKR